MDHLTEFATTTLAGALGSIVAVLVVGANLLLVPPVALGVGAVAVLALRVHANPTAPDDARNNDARARDGAAQFGPEQA